jgi:hypothetical protein
LEEKAGRLDATGEMRILAETAYHPENACGGDNAEDNADKTTTTHQCSMLQFQGTFIVRG